jgi:hypothetical protein
VTSLVPRLAICRHSLILVLAFCGAVAPTAAQSPSWTSRFDSGAHDVKAYPAADPHTFYTYRPTRHLAVDASGFVYVAGTLDTTWGRSCFVAKYDALGKVAWMRVAPHENCTGAAMTLDGLGGVYLLGNFESYLKRNDSGDWLLLKYDSAGTRLWTRTWDDPALGDNDQASDIVANAAGVVVSGTTCTYCGPPQTTVVTRRYDAAGNLIWESRYGGTGEKPFDLAMDQSGRVTLSGVNAAGQAFAVRYDAVGAQTWAHTLTQTSTLPQVLVYAPLAVDEDGSAWMASTSQQRTLVVKWTADGQEAWRTSYGPIDSGPSSLSVRDGLAAVLTWQSGGYALTRLDAAGGISWARTGAAEIQAYIVETTGTGAIAVAGIRNSSSLYDFWVGLYDAAGNLNWQQTYVTPDEYDAPTTLVVGPDGSLHLSGLSQNASDITTKYSSSGAFIWVVKEPPAPGQDQFLRPTFDGDGGVIISALDAYGETAELRRYSATGKLTWARPVHPRLYHWAADREGGVVGIGNPGHVPLEGALIERYDRNGARLWSRTYKRTEDSSDYASSVGVDLAGNVVVAISDPLSELVTVIKYDPNGLVVWTRQQPATSLVGLAIDDSGAIYAAGVGVWKLNGQDLLAFKYSAQGDLQWSRTWSNTASSSEFLSAMAMDGADNLVLAGITGPSVDGDRWDFATVKYDRFGTLLWARTRQSAGGVDRASDVSVDGVGNVIVTGLSREAPGYGIRTVSYDPEGNERWARFFPAGALQDGESTWGPSLASSLDGDTTIATRTWNGDGFDFTVLRYDRAGLLLWVSPMIGDGGRNDGAWWVTVDGNGAIAVSGDIWTQATASDGVLLHFPGGSTPRSYHTLSPCRVLDTRDPNPSGPSPLAAGVTRTMTATGACGIPETARALALNVTVTGATAAGNLRVFPGGFPAPNASNANYLPGQTRANNAVVGLGSGGRLSTLASQTAGTVDVILDVSGYFE